MANASVKDLRELICVSRLTARLSDDDDDELEEDDIDLSQQLNLVRIHSSRSSSASSQRQGGADSGLGKSANPSPDVADESKESKKNRNSKHRPLPPIRSRESPASVDSPPRLPNGRPVTGEGAKQPLKPIKSPVKTNFDDLLVLMDGAVVTDWLTRANQQLELLTAWRAAPDNFAHFAHFWLSDFEDSDRQELLQMEYSIVAEEVVLAFKIKEKAKLDEIKSFINAVFHEYPTKLLTQKGKALFLDYMLILTSSRNQRYKEFLADVRCSTRVAQYAQWILATRSFALICIWSAALSFFQNVLAQGIRPSTPSMRCSYDELSHIYSAIRHNYGDVMLYFLKSNHCKSDMTDSQGKSLVFLAAMYDKPAILDVLRTKADPPVNVNQRAKNGNTPLHAAASSGLMESVRALLKFPTVEVDANNPQLENATPLHLAVMYGHKAVVEVLLAAKANWNLRMGDLTVEQIAKDFGNEDILGLFPSLTSDR